MEKMRLKDFQQENRRSFGPLFMKIRVRDYWELLQEELSHLDEARLKDWSSSQSDEKRELLKGVKFRSKNYRNNIELEKKLRKAIPNYEEMSMAEFLRNVDETVQTQELTDAIMEAFFSIPALIVNEKSN